MKKWNQAIILYLCGLLCGFVLYHLFGLPKKSNELILQKNGEEITLDFSDHTKGTKFQFFSDYYIESTRDEIIIHPY